MEATVAFPKRCQGKKILSSMRYEWTYHEVPTAIPET